MSEALILNAEGVTGLCGVAYAKKHASESGGGRPRESAYRCSRPKGHGGCHWAPLGRIAEAFLIWRPGVTVLRSRLYRMRLLAAASCPGRRTRGM